MDILGNVVPYIGSEEEKMEEETLKLLGKLEGHAVSPLSARITAHCNRVAVEDGHTECVSIKLAKPATRDEILAAWPGSDHWPDRACRRPRISLFSGPAE